MISTTSNSIKTDLLSGVATQKPLSGQVSDLKYDTQSHADFNRALSKALLKENSNATAQIMHDPGQSDFKDELETTRGFLERRFKYISDNVSEGLITNSETNNNFVNGVNSAWKNLMRNLQTLVGDNIAKLDKVLALPKPAEV